MKLNNMKYEKKRQFVSSNYKLIEKDKEETMRITRLSKLQVEDFLDDCTHSEIRKWEWKYWDFILWDFKETQKEKRLCWTKDILTM